jgi:uncharacterized protein with HEPN domain
MPPDVKSIVVRDEITWRIVQDKLPVLRQEIEELLKAS